MDENSQGKKRLVERTWLLVIACLFLPPVGAILLWIAGRPRNKAVRIALTVFLALVTLFIAIPTDSDKKEEGSRTEESSEATKEVKQEKLEKTKETEKAKEPKKTKEPEKVKESEKAKKSKETKEPEEASTFEVTMDVKDKTTDGQTTFKITTNLPNDMKLMLTLSRDGGFRAQDSVVIKNGNATSSGFSEKGNALDGNYKLHVSSSMTKLQPESVQKMIGKKGERMEGSLVKTEDGDTMVRADFDFTFKAEPPKEGAKTEAPEGKTGENSTSDEDKLNGYVTIIDAMLAKNFGNGNYSVSQEDGFVTISVWADGLAAAASTAAAGNSEMADQWNTMLSSTEYMADSMKKSLDAMELEKEGHVMLNVVNDVNHENTLATYMDGVLVYNSVN